MKTKRTFALLMLLGLISFFVTSCDKKVPEHFNIAFYNVENLFDTINDEGVNDGEFTPGASVSWDTKRYNKKLNDIARVFASIDSTSLPLIIGMAEVEKLGVLKDLINKTQLSNGNYGIVHFDSPDERGIDVAMLYRKDFFTPLHARPYPLKFDFDPKDKTRDMLYVKGVAANSDTLHLLVDHWPSRSGGQEKSDPKRRAAAASARKVVDSIFKYNANANIIMMGDMNDNPTDTSLMEVFKARRLSNNVSTDEMYNLALNTFEKGEGTLYYRSWDLFDQMIVSGNIIKGNMDYKLTPNDIHIVREDWMLFTRKDGVKVPNRTAGRNEYYGGISDHLPVYISFSK